MDILVGSSCVGLKKPMRNCFPNDDEDGKDEKNLSRLYTNQLNTFQHHYSQFGIFDLSH